VNEVTNRIVYRRMTEFDLKSLDNNEACRGSNNLHIHLVYEENTFDWSLQLAILTVNV